MQVRELQAAGRGVRASVFRSRGGVVRKGFLAGVVAVSALTLALPSAAAPNRSVTLSSRERVARWSSETGISPYTVTPAGYAQLRCTEALNACDYTLMRLGERGTISVDVSARAPVGYPPLLSIELYRSDAQGGLGLRVPVSKRRGGNAESFTSTRLPAGYYLSEVEWRQGAGSYDAIARFAG